MPTTSNLASGARWKARPMSGSAPSALPNRTSPTPTPISAAVASDTAISNTGGTGGGGSSAGSSPNDAWARESPVEAGSRPSVMRMASSSPDW